MQRTALFLVALFASDAQAAGYADHPRSAELLSRLSAEFRFNAEELTEVREALAEAQRVERLLQAEQNNKERTLNWDEYRPIHINPGNIARGVELLHAQHQALAAAEERFGVPPAVSAAILGVETKYGAHATPHRVLDALATQGFEHPTRSAFFFSELIEFFALCREYGFHAPAVKGSYAGAMGAAQFMPSNYRRLALDFDGNGLRDLWALPDAIGSVAHYLVRYAPERGFRRGEPLIVPARVAQDIPEGIPVNAKKTSHPYQELTKLGITAAAELPADLPVGLIALDGADGRQWWLGMHNFYAVMSYNPRIHYAMAVAQLAAELQQAAGSDAE